MRACFLLFLLFSLIGNAQYVIDGTASDRTVALATGGERIVAVGFQTAAPLLNGSAQTEFGNDDAFLSVTDRQGNLLQHHVLGGALDDRSEAVAVDAAGNIYWSGSYRGDASFGDLQLTDPMNQKVTFLLKLDPDGNLLWHVVLRGSGFKIIEDLAHQDGTLAAVGSFSETLEIDNDLGVVADADRSALFLTFDDQTGALTGVETLGDTGTFNTRSVCATPDGAFHLFGDFTGSATVGGKTIQTGTSDEDLFYARRTPAAGLAALQRIGGVQPSLASEVTGDAESNVYLGGAFFGVLNTEDGQSVQSPNFNNEGFLLKITPDGSVDWIRTFGSGAAETIRALALADGKLYATGIFSEAFTSEGVSFVPGTGFSTGYVARFDPSTGELREALPLPADDNIFCFALAADTGTPPVVGGQFLGTLSVPGGGNLNAQNSFAGFWLPLGNDIVPVDAPTSSVPFRVYPNPLRERLHFERAVDFRLYDTQGTLRRSGFGTSVGVRDLAAGAYVLVVEGEVRWVTKF